MKRSIACLVLFCLLVPSLSLAQVTEERDRDAPAQPADDNGEVKLSDVEQMIVRRTNEFRQEHGREKVSVNKDLTQAAKYFANFMARTDKYGHTADGNRPSERASQHGYDYCIVSENIAYQYSSTGFTDKELARRFVQGWIESPKHRENMLDRYVVDIGVGVAQSEESGNYYAVQMFGRPQSMQIEFQLTNEADETVRYTVGGRSFPLPPRYTRTHQRCRPTTIDLGWTEEEESLKPEDGAHFVVRRNEAGNLTIEKQSGQAAQGGSGS